jgi:hypothetical protein
LPSSVAMVSINVLHPLIRAKATHLFARTPYTDPSFTIFTAPLAAPPSYAIMVVVESWKPIYGTTSAASSTGSREWDTSAKETGSMSLRLLGDTRGGLISL